MAYYVLAQDHFEYITNEQVFPTLLRPKPGPIPPNGIPDHLPSVEENMFAFIAGIVFPNAVIRREVLLTDICEIDPLALAAVLNKRHASRPAEVPAITAMATAKLNQRIGERKRCDFLLYDGQTSVLERAIEVDGLYHLNGHQPSNDFSKNLVIEGMGAELLRFYSADIDALYNQPPMTWVAAFAPMMLTALANWTTFRNFKSRPNLQLHLP